MSLIAALAEKATERESSVAKVILDALSGYGIAPTRWTGVWLETLTDETLLEAVDALDG